MLYHISLLVLIILGFITTMSDPTDPLSLVGLQIENNSKTIYCAICKCSVKHNSKHCGVCNRCVSGFDHHCTLVNNCIGEKNYKVFFGTIVAFLVNSLLVLAFSIYCVIKYSVHDRVTLMLIHRKVDKSDEDQPWVTLITVLVFYGIVTTFFSAVLVAHHIWLRHKNLTTFQYILNKRIASKTSPSPSINPISKSHDVSTTTIECKDSSII